MEEFNKVVYYNIIEGYNKKLIKFNDYTKTISNELYLYIKSIWILPYEKKFIKAYTNNYLHFNSTTSSRAEGSHSVLKRYLQVSIHELDIVCKKITHAIDA
jgi:hypothetical protein